MFLKGSFTLSSFFLYTFSDLKYLYEAMPKYTTMKIPKTGTMKLITYKNLYQLRSTVNEGFERMKSRELNIRDYFTNNNVFSSTLLQAWL